MEADTQAQVAFFLTGSRPVKYLDAVDGLGLKPALFAGYRELTQLRYDFPLVLMPARADGVYALSLSGVVDRALALVAQGSDGERIRKHVLRVEQTIRTLIADGATGSLSTLWDRATQHVATETDATVSDSIRRARAAIVDDGEVVDCDAALPSRLLQHAWRAVQAQKASVFRQTTDRLKLKLSDILRADYERSEEGRSASHLQASLGEGFGGAFDFEAMSRLLGKALPKDALPESRRARIRELLDVLNRQQFFPTGDRASASDASAVYGFLFDSCGDALAAFRARMPKMIELARAIAIAELEIDSQYREAPHDALFAQFGANGLDPQELEPFPDYLVCVNAARLQPADHVQLMEILASGLPIKVLLQIDDILEESPNSEGNLTTGMRIRQIASMAMGLNEAYVLQSSSSNLYRFRDRLVRGLSSHGPALFSVFSGARGTSSGISPYLMSAAAMESRAFPAFTYDPSAGPNWASRFSLDANTQVDLDWPIEGFTYEDEANQRVTEDVAFTVVDFVASDARYAKHLARVPRARWNGSMIPVDQSLTFERKGVPDQVPSLLMVDEGNALHRVIADERLIREARRCREMWHSLQELGGVHNSHAENLLSRERKVWEDRARADAETHTEEHAESATGQAPAAIATPVPAAAPAETERSPDEAYIETARCSTCNECTTINKKMFAYNANQQAYIADITAGTYAQLVEAAESCQVSIIHPGKPRNQNEPGLERLLERAAAFP
ncbi:MAG: hypothetical protein IPP90_13745 [Gemmatimonadaceae bacterium]|nr:hypothetical protein [Gemmatimonadaceae bacterium]